MDDRSEEPTAAKDPPRDPNSIMLDTAIAEIKRLRVEVSAERTAYRNTIKTMVSREAYEQRTRERDEALAELAALRETLTRHTVIVYRDLAAKPDDRFHLETGLSLAAVRARLRAFAALTEDRKQFYAVPGDPITELDTKETQ